MKDSIIIQATLVKELENDSIFLTENRIKVNDRIENKQTIVFLNIKKAYQYARKKKTYVYELFVERKISKVQYSNAKFFGYAVPR